MADPNWKAHKDEIGDADQVNWEPLEYVLIRFTLSEIYLEMFKRLLKTMVSGCDT